MTPERIQRLEALDAFAGGVTHELNNALAAVIGYTELCLDEATPEELRENLKDILQAAERARGLIRQFQTFRQSGTREPEPFETRILIKEAVKMLRAFIPPHVKIRQSIRGAGMINADPVAFNSLVMTMGAVVYRLLNHRGGQLEIDLMDVKSMPPLKGDDAHAFADGYQLLSFRASGELTVTKTTADDGRDSADFTAELDNMARACGGLFLLEQRDENTVDLSVMLPSFAEVEKPMPEMKPVECPLRILFVDDDEPAARMGKKTLERLGCRVEAHGRGESALSAFRKDPWAYDLVFTDLLMPEMNGDALARAILEIRPDVPVVLYSGCIDRDMRENLSTIGAKALLTKPLRREEIAEVIRNAVT